MSDDKIRPRTERIARLAGSTTFKDFREGFGGKPLLVDADVCAALALCRTRRSDAECDTHDIGPEVLETYYGSTQQHRRLLVTAYLKHKGKDDEPVTKVIVRRMAATLAAQRIAGASHSRAQEAEYAFIVSTRLENLRDQIADAYGWYMEQHDTALPSFAKILKAIIEGNLVRHLKAKAERAEKRAAA